MASKSSNINSLPQPYITPVGIGGAIQIVGLTVIFLDWFMGFAPGFGTLANMYFVGFFTDLMIAWNLIPVQTELSRRFGLLTFSIVIMGIASLSYLKTQLGVGPRDGLMIGLVKKLDKPVAYVRGAIEITALILGYLLGRSIGPVGIGTLVTALTVGYQFDRCSTKLSEIERFLCFFSDFSRTLFSLLPVFAGIL